MSWYQIHYAHLECDAFWTGQWSCACNDRCPVCDLEIEPEDYVDLTAVIGFDEKTEEWIVSLSPPDAEDDPGYRPTRFKERAEADAFLASSLGA